MSNNTIVDIKAEKEKAQNKIQEMGRRVLVCAGTGCVANGALEVLEQFEKLGADVQKLQDSDKYTTIKTGCKGYCEQGVLVTVPKGDTNITYVQVKSEDVEEIVNSHLKNGQIVERLLYKDPETQKATQKFDEIGFYKKQVKRSLCNCGKINPEDISEALASDSYQALENVIKNYKPEQVVEEVVKSGLRGRGGGGFPTGRKWQLMAKGDKKYVVCNADEGDPGAFMDCSVMEGDPHKLLEGMIIAAYAVGADEGYIYVRAEYPLAIQRLKIAIEQAKELGLLGENILGADFSFNIKLKEGAGAFVCGEETALIASIEGERGMPRSKPPFPAVKGLFGKPTLINNVETFSNVPSIMLNGADWYKEYGKDSSTGTKTFSITGEVKNTGLIEVPMGTTLREVVFDIGGGIRNNKKFKAVQIGGPSGGCLTEEQLDITLDYDSLKKAGAMVGSGGLVVLNEDTCIVEIARFFMSFTQSESCGKCVPCREGTKNMLIILENIVNGKAEMKDLDLLEELALAVQDGSLCGLGKTAPNPVLSTLKHFRDEYIAHIQEKRCPAGVCTAFKKIIIEAELCKGCSKCARTCPVNAIEGKIKEPYTVDQDKCIKCGACLDSCPFGAIKEI